MHVEQHYSSKWSRSDWCQGVNFESTQCRYVHLWNIKGSRYWMNSLIFCQKPVKILNYDAVIFVFWNKDNWMPISKLNNFTFFVEKFCSVNWNRKIKILRYVKRRNANLLMQRLLKTGKNCYLKTLWAFVSITPIRLSERFTHHIYMSKTFNELALDEVFDDEVIFMNVVTIYTSK